MFILTNINSLYIHYSYKLSSLNLVITYLKLILNSTIFRQDHIKETRKIEDGIYTKARPPPAMHLYVNY